jgi:hypothetical protein
MGPRVHPWTVVFEANFVATENASSRKSVGISGAYEGILKEETLMISNT